MKNGHESRRLRISHNWRLKISVVKDLYCYTRHLSLETWMYFVALTSALNLNLSLSLSDMYLKSGIQEFCIYCDCFKQWWMQEFHLDPSTFCMELMNMKARQSFSILHRLNANLIHSRDIHALPLIPFLYEFVCYFFIFNTMSCYSL